MTNEIKICGAKAKDGVCFATPVKGKNRCRLHGGLSTGTRSVEGLKCISEANITAWAERKRQIALARKLERENRAAL